MRKRAAFCGSFDPLTVGHLDLIRRASSVFDEVWVFVSRNSAKKELWSADTRAGWIEEACQDLPNVHAEISAGLAVESARQKGCGVLLRGIRNETDMAYESNMSYMNTVLDPEIETLAMFCRPEYTYISSSNVRELLKWNQSIEAFVPSCVFRDLQPAFYSQRKEAA